MLRVFFYIIFAIKAVSVLMFCCFTLLKSPIVLYAIKPKSVIRACLDFDFLEGWILFGF